MLPIVKKIHVHFIWSVSGWRSLVGSSCNMQIISDFILHCSSVCSIIFLTARSMWKPKKNHDNILHLVSTGMNDTESKDELHNLWFQLILQFCVEIFLSSLVLNSPSLLGLFSPTLVSSIHWITKSSSFSTSLMKVFNFWFTNKNWLW